MVIDLRALRHAIALAEHGNFSRAAEALHLTQPALSRSIQTLEAGIGASLFERQRGAVEPTDIGRLLLRHARAIDADARDLDREIRLAKGLELGDLRIAVGPWGGSALIGPVVGRLNAMHPRLRVKLIIAPWQELPERARAREVDIVVGELREIEALADFELCPLSPHDTIVVGRTGHPLVQSGSANAKAIFGYPLAGPRLPADAKQELLAMAGKAQSVRGKRREVLTIECDSSSVLKSVLQESDALSCMPRFLVEADLAQGRLAVVSKLDLGLRVRFGAAWLRGRTIGGAAVKFVELLKAHDAGLAAGKTQSLGNARAAHRRRRT